MKVIIAGSRTITDSSLVADAITASGFHITMVVSGTCRGVDQLAEQWAQRHRLPIERFPADWQRLGRRAGPVRNQAMVDHVVTSDHGALIAIWNGVSPGTRHTIQYAQRRGLVTHIHLVGTAQPVFATS